VNLNCLLTEDLPQQKEVFTITSSGYVVLFAALDHQPRRRKVISDIDTGISKEESL